MTTETKTTMQLGDIYAVEFICERCHASLCLALDSPLTIPTSCPNCHKETFVINDLGHRELSELLRLLKVFQKPLNGFSGHLQLRFAIRSLS